jgi:Lipoxygenase
LRENGFARRADVPADVTTVDELADLVSGIIFNLTGQHSATHFDALDLYGFIPDVPALMRQPVPDRRDHVVTRNTLSATLPDQFPDAYYVCLAFVLQVHHADQVIFNSNFVHMFLCLDSVLQIDTSLLQRI